MLESTKTQTIFFLFTLIFVLNSPLMSIISSNVQHDYNSTFCTQSPPHRELLFRSSKIESTLDNGMNLSLPVFPKTIDYDINIVFIGINHEWVNESKFLDLLPKTSQISRYVPLSYLYETFINYSLKYHIYFLHNDVAVDLADHITSYGAYSYTIEMGVYWSGRTNVTKYKRSAISGPRDYLSSISHSMKTDNNNSVSISSNAPTIFVTNLFVNNSQFYANQSATPHVFYLEKMDIDTDRFSNLRDKARFAPGFDWTDNNWLLLDISSGPSAYQDVDSEFTNSIEYIEGTVDPNMASEEFAEIIRAGIFSRFLPTYLYEPQWHRNVQLAIALYYDPDSNASDYLDQEKIREVYTELFPFSNVNVSFSPNEIVQGDDLSVWLDYIKDYTDYSTWASQLVDFIVEKEDSLFGDYDSSSTHRYLCGIFATDNISGKDSSFGFTYTPLGRSSALGSAVTITPSTITADGEGLTQTTIHEIGHACSLRHPHDYRSGGSLFKYWSWDTCETPLSYLHTVYSWNNVDRNSLFRGQYRYLFNKSHYLFNSIQSTLLARQFPLNRYPSFIYESLSNLSTVLTESLNSFNSHDYYNALDKIIPAYSNLTDLLANSSSLPNYFIPIVNFDNINKSKIDYGDNILISGSIVSYQTPSVMVFTSTKNLLASITVFSYENFLYDSDFKTSFSSLLCSTEEETYISVRIFDGTDYYHFALSFEIIQLRVSILSPSANMYLDLSYSLTFKVIGTYYSVSNSSRLHVLYGSYWYVEDHDDEDSTYWIHVNKSTGNEWDHTVNSSYFINGINLIKVRISNNNSHFIDTIQIQVTGLPQTTSHQSESTTTTEPSNGTTSTSLSPIPPELLSIIIVVSLVGSIILLKLRTRRKKQKILDKVTKDEHDVSDKISDLKGTIDKKSSDLEKLLIKEKGEEFIPDVRKKFRPRRRKR